jgi:hypothetical protein
MSNGATVSSQRNPGTGNDECIIKGTIAGLDQVTIIVHRAYQWDAMKQTILREGARAVTGLGDDAFEAPTIGYNVRKGDKGVQVIGAPTNRAVLNDKATHYLAERAVSRL